MNREAFKGLLRGHEALELAAYPDPLSPLGKACARDGLPMREYRSVAGWEQLSGGRWTIGYGHTGPDVHEGMVITREEAERLLDADCASVVAHCRQYLAWFNRLDDARQNVVCSMVFNMGPTGFAGFRKMIAAIERSDYPCAANEMLCSEWASQVGRRAAELAQMMRAGDTIH
jgi:lysozyme